MSFETGVFPVYDIEFKVGTKGRSSVEEDLKTVADMETFSIAIDGKIEKWTSMTTAGWERALMTGKALSISLKGKRNVGDPGNDYVADTAWKDGLACSSIAQVKFPNGAKLDFDCIVDVKSVGGGDSTNVAPLEFDLVGDGKPDWTPAPAAAVIALSSSVPANNAATVAVTAKPVLTFNNAISDASGITLLNATDGALVANTISLDASNKVVTISPSANLTASKTYIITLSEVRDIYGQELAKQIIKFTT
ncbi:phage tail tube protein [Clostridium intestinale]|uniref:Ig-like domain-containing protein n=1 Tax=Clostridium intestinale TaxID=36845 RepID=A0A7D6ZFT1_9CLOT|nr:Ig-like domain-containing protein [Clostridium intestinale]QLY79181.1 Ig-like domain-containing protein [Clostridium intestinale]